VFIHDVTTSNKGSGYPGSNTGNSTYVRDNRRISNTGYSTLNSVSTKSLFSGDVISGGDNGALYLWRNGVCTKGMHMSV
jgi:hypothetical protein